MFLFQTVYVHVTSNHTMTMRGKMREEKMDANDVEEKTLPKTSCRPVFFKYFSGCYFSADHIHSPPLKKLLSIQLVLMSPITPYPIPRGGGVGQRERGAVPHIVC